MKKRMNCVAGELRPFDRVEELRDLLKSKGIRQLDVAQALGVSIGSVSHWLNGYRAMPSEVLTKIRRIAGVGHAE